MEKVTEKAGMNDNTDVLVVGTGYLGSVVAEMSHPGDTKVFTTTRGSGPTKDDTKTQWMREQGFRPLQFDWTDPTTFGNLPLNQLSANARVLVAVSYDRNSGMQRYDSQVGGLTNLLRILPADARICYISTTGVYHQTDGRWVDESSPTHPRRLGGRVHLQAEQRLHAMRPEGRWTILRLAGIYGSGRVPRVADVIAGRKIAAPDQGYLNLIHVRDAARAVLSAWQQLDGSPTDDPIRQNKRLYVVGDDCPVPRREFYGEIARQCRVGAPQFISPGPDAAVSMRSDSNKRVWNRKLRRDLLASLEFPNYRCGLADVLASPLE